MIDFRSFRNWIIRLMLVTRSESGRFDRCPFEERVYIIADLFESRLAPDEKYTRSAWTRLLSRVRLLVYTKLMV